MGKNIDTLKYKTSAGENGISSKLIKYCKKEITFPLTDIINKSFSQWMFPSELKLAKVFPKYKCGPANLATSYCPLALLSTFSKIIEPTALWQVVEHLKQDNLLTTIQHGFTEGRSTANPLSDSWKQLLTA